MELLAVCPLRLLPLLRLLDLNLPMLNGGWVETEDGWIDT